MGGKRTTEFIGLSKSTRNKSSLVEGISEGKKLFRGSVCSSEETQRVNCLSCLVIGFISSGVREHKQN
jgi:hypothetical protein